MSAVRSDDKQLAGFKLVFGRVRQLSSETPRNCKHQLLEESPNFWFAANCWDLVQDVQPGFAAKGCCPARAGLGNGSLGGLRTPGSEAKDSWSPRSTLLPLALGWFPWLPSVVQETNPGVSGWTPMASVLLLVPCKMTPSPQNKPI